MPGLAVALRAGRSRRTPAFRFTHLAWEGGDLSAVDKGTPAGAPGGNRVQLHAGAGTIDQSFDPDENPLEGAAALTGVDLQDAVAIPGRSDARGFRLSRACRRFPFRGRL